MNIDVRQGIREQAPRTVAQAKRTFVLAWPEIRVDPVFRTLYKVYRPAEQEASVGEARRKILVG
jgi:hypothetical protein